MASQIKKFVPAGVIPATLLAFDDELAIDQKASQAHIRHVASVKGVTGIAVNGHASEVHGCSPDEQRAIVEFAVDEAGDRIPIVAGVYSEASREARQLAKAAAEAGASALLVFPPATLGLGGMDRFEMVTAYFDEIVSATDLPIVLFQYPANSPLCYRRETLLKLFERVPSIVAIKDFICDPQQHEMNIRIFQSLARPVSVLTAHSTWLLPSLVLGAKGILSGAGSIIAALQAELFESVANKDLDRAQEVYSRIYHVTQVFYRHPLVDMHNRMKEGLVMQGLLQRAVVRPPLSKLSEQEIADLREALTRANLIN